jgi:threonine aldolase
MSFVDLRSDTVTRPTPAMRRAMAEAEVGDDVYGEDPTVRALEEETARLLGQEDALYVPSGTMANQIGLALLAVPGSEIVVEQDSHVMNYEGGAAAALWGITLRPLPGVRGRLTPAQVRSMVSPANEHVAPVLAVAVENTHNRHAGSVWPRADLLELYRDAHAAGLLAHLDGARLWNACAACGEEPAALAGLADTVSVCFSKGLGAPVGSVLASTGDRIRRARYLRKRLGGGMRQAGIVAAGALYALRHHRHRLIEDHRRAARLGECLREMPGLEVLPVESNMVIVDLAGRNLSAYERVERLAADGVLAHAVSPSRVRFVTHMDLDDAGLERALLVLRAALGGSR